MLHYIPTSWVPLKSPQQWSKLVFNVLQDEMKSFKPKEAREEFVSRCRELPMFGVHYYPVQIKGSAIESPSMLLGVHSKSVMICKDVNTVKTIIKLQFIDTMSLESGGRELKITYKSVPAGAIAGAASDADREEISMYSTFSPQIFAHIREYLSIFGLQTFSEVIEQIRVFESISDKAHGPASVAKTRERSSSKKVESAPKVGVRESVTALKVVDQSSILRERMKLAGASEDDIESVLRCDSEML